MSQSFPSKVVLLALLGLCSSVMASQSPSPSSVQAYKYGSPNGAMFKISNGENMVLLYEETWAQPWEGVLHRPTTIDVHEMNNKNLGKRRTWTPQEAAQKQSELDRIRASFAEGAAGGGQAGSFANGAITGTWKSVGPSNMPGCWDQSYVDSTSNKIWGVTCAHYGGSQWVWQGTLAGDDFKLLNTSYPTRIIKVFGVPNGNSHRTVVATESGKVIFTDDGLTWTESTGLSGVVSLTLNRKNGNILFAATKTAVYKSTDKGLSFTLVQNFGSSAESHIYSPLYGNQPGADKVYLSRNGAFFVLNSGASSFTAKGTWTWPGSADQFSIGGDSRKIHVHSKGKFYSSTDEGQTWVQKTPRGDYYGDQAGTWSAGLFLGVSPADPNVVIGGYTGPLLTKDGFNTVVGNTYGWGQYQNQTDDNIIRTKYHPDFQSSQIFYDKTGKLLAIYSSDGGLIRSYTSFVTAPIDAATYTSTTFSNLTMIGVPTSEIYRGSMGTGYLNPMHLYTGTQDQGGQTFQVNSTGENMRVIQSPGGDGPQCYTADGKNAWCASYTADKVYPPKAMYNGTTFRGFNNANGTVLTLSTGGGWYFHDAFVDKASPTTNFWPLSKTLNRVSWNGSSLTSTATTRSGGNYFAGMAQSTKTPDLMIVFKGGKVYKSTNRGVSWDQGVATGTGDNGSSAWDRCGAWILPTNDQWMLAACPSNAGVVSVLSKNGGSSWANVTGSLPSGDFTAMVGTSDGKYVFVGSAFGPYVFVVAQEKWYHLAQGSATPWFNASAIEWLSSSSTVRFGTWGSGVWDFAVTGGNVSSSSVNSSSSTVSSSSSLISSSSVLSSSSVVLSSSSILSSSSVSLNDCVQYPVWKSNVNYQPAGTSTADWLYDGSSGANVQYQNAVYATWWANAGVVPGTSSAWSKIRNCAVLSSSSVVLSSSSVKVSSSSGISSSSVITSLVPKNQLELHSWDRKGAQITAQGDFVVRLMDLNGQEIQRVRGVGQQRVLWGQEMQAGPVIIELQHGAGLKRWMIQMQ
jgi:hypothetical protein